MELYSTPDIQDYFEYILKQHAEKTINPSIRTYVNKIESTITFKIKTGYYLKFSTPEIMKLLESTTSEITDFFFFSFVNISSFDNKFYVFKIKVFAKSLQLF